MLISPRPLPLGDRIYFRTKFGVSSETLKDLEQLCLSRKEIVRLLEERRKRGLPPNSVWAGSGA